MSELFISSVDKYAYFSFLCVLVGECISVLAYVLTLISSID